MSLVTSQPWQHAYWKKLNNHLLDVEGCSVPSVFMGWMTETDNIITEKRLYKRKMDKEKRRDFPSLILHTIIKFYFFKKIRYYHKKLYLLNYLFK